MLFKDHMMKHRKMNGNYYDFVTKMIDEMKPKSAIEVGYYHPILSILHGTSIDKKVYLDKTGYGEEEIKKDGGLFYKNDVIEDELTFKKNEFDVLLCLQVIEHVEDPKMFVDKIWDFAKVKIFSVPYLWGYYSGHIHHNITEEKFLEWFPKKPDSLFIIKENFDHRQSNRLIGVFK